MRSQAQANESIRKTHKLLQSKICKNRKCKYYDKVYGLNCSIFDTPIGEECLKLPRKDREGYE